MSEARANLQEGACRKDQLARIVGSPTRDRAVALHCASMTHARADLAILRVTERGNALVELVGSPARDGAIKLDAAGVLAPRAQLAKSVVRNGRLTTRVVSPTHCRAVGPHGAAVVPSSRDRRVV